MLKRKLNKNVENSIYTTALVDCVGVLDVRPWFNPQVRRRLEQSKIHMKNITPAASSQQFPDKNDCNDHSSHNYSHILIMFTFCRPLL